LEGEGFGTAYEYAAKERIVKAFVKGKKRILVYGLPEKYGFSLDLFLHANENNAECFFFNANNKKIPVQIRAEMKKIGVKIVKGDFISKQRFDSVMCSEVIQKMSSSALKNLQEVIKKRSFLFFAPNGNNGSHKKISGLSGLNEQKLRKMFGEKISISYLDIPPFPPGIKSNNAKQKSVLLKIFAGIGIQIFSFIERFYPQALKKRKAHIICALSEK
jgi:hypothetical protein